jgi:hypothetical protein
MVTCELTADQASIINHCLAERRDSVIRKMDVYRRMGDTLSPELYEKLVAIGHSELDLLLDASAKLKS